MFPSPQAGVLEDASQNVLHLGSLIVPAAGRSNMLARQLPCVPTNSRSEYRVPAERTPRLWDAKHLHTATAGHSSPTDTLPALAESDTRVTGVQATHWGGHGVAPARAPVPLWCVFISDAHVLHRKRVCGVATAHAGP